MDPNELKRLLKGVAAGKVGVADAIARLRALPFEDIEFARVDHHRALRRGAPEAVFGEGKSPHQCAQIVDRIARSGSPALVTRANREQLDAVRKLHPEAEWHEVASLIAIRPTRVGRTTRAKGKKEIPDVLVITAGTSDIPIAEEAAITAELFGTSVGRIFDVGVAGLHRLVGERPRLEAAKVLVVVAGMEGALPSVVAGMVGTPVIGVPTSVGYGVTLGGLTALFGMLTSCAGGLTVVNIDNGFGAGYAAALLSRRMAPPRRP